MQNNFATIVADNESNEATTEFLGRGYMFPQRAATGATDGLDELVAIRSQVDSDCARLIILASNPVDLA